jgi:hypothetical protein
MHTFGIKTTIPLLQQHLTALVVLNGNNNMLIKPANRAKRTRFTKVARVIYVTPPMVRLRPAGIKTEVTNSKKRLCFFITMKKK